MTETDKIGPTVRVTVKLRPDEYDELNRHVLPYRFDYECIFA
jgi:hypothetical protein